MKSFVILSALSAFAQTALADLAGIDYGTSPAFPPRNAPVHRRDIDYSCFSSVVTRLSPPTPAAELSDWAEVSMTTLIDGCTVTIPASLSDEYLSYVSAVSTWATTVDDEAGKIHTKCGADTFSISLTLACSASQTVVFTGDASGTAATPTSEPTTTVLPAMKVDEDVIYIGAAPQQKSVAVAALVFSAVLGFVIAL